MREEGAVDKVWMGEDMVRYIGISNIAVVPFWCAQVGF
jgi:hypothetical protein